MKDVYRASLRVFRRHQTDARKGFVLTFALFVALAPLAGVVRAQGSPKPNAKQYELAEDTPTYIIYQTPSGETGCRMATRAEIEEIRSGQVAGVRQINHLGAKGAAGVEALSAGLTIILRGTTQLEANPAAKQAFITAAAKWEALISSQITVVIDVDYGPDFFGSPYSSANTLGATSSSGFLIDFAEVRQRLVNRAPVGSEEASILNSLPASSLPTDIGNVTRVFVPPSVMRALGLLGPTPSSDTQTVSVPRIGFNSNFAFDFDPTNGVTSNQTDFDSVAVHEIGHALGFNSQVGARELDPTRTLMATVWDFYRFRPGVGTAANFSGAPRVLSSGTSLLDPHVHFSGGAEIQLSTGKPDGTGGDEEQASHWKDDGAGIPNIGIMDPTLRRGTHIEISASDLKAIDFFGYTVGVVPAPANDNFSAAQTLAGPAGRVTATNSGATKETGEPSHSPDNNPGGKSVWYSWQPSANGPVTFTTGPSASGAGSNYDTLLAAYTGAAVNALSLLARNDDSGGTGITTSTIQFNAVAGTTYRIAVDGYNADTGSIALSWNQTEQAPTPATVRFDSPSFFALESDGHAVVRVSRYIGGSGAFTVSYATSDGAATAGSDYTPVSGTLSFAAGESLKTFTVPVINDTNDEPNENIGLTLTAGAGAELSTPSSAWITIIDNDDPTSALSVSDVTVGEGNAGTVNAVFSVGLLAASGQPVSVNYATSDGTAAAGSDYAAAAGTLNFAPGETSKTVSVAVNGDGAAEANETFFLNLSGAAGATLSDAQGEATIVNDDGGTTPNALIAFNAPSYTFAETGSTSVLVLTRSGNLAATVTVDVRTVDNAAAVPCGDTVSLPGVAFARCDYATTLDTVTFGPNETTKTVSVPLIDDAHGEPNETVQLMLGSPSAGAQLGPQFAASLVITSNEAQGQTGAVNPIGGNSFFVRQHYLDFLSREPEAGEPWTNVLNRCAEPFNLDPNSSSAGCDRLLVSSSFFGAPEFELKGRYVFRYYKVSFGRLPEYSEIVADMRRVTGATAPETIAKRSAFPGQWVQRADFKSAFDGMSNADFVNTLMNRYGVGLLLITTFNPSTPDGGAKVQLSRTGMTGALNNGQWTRAQIVRAIADSDEVGRAEFNPSFVAMQYYGYLRRTPEPNGYQAWLNYLNANPTDFRTMVNGFANSGEYRLRFGG